MTLLTPKDLAAFLSKSEAWVRAHATQLGGVRIGKEWRFHPGLLGELTPTIPDAATLAVLCRSTNVENRSGASAGAKQAGNAKNAASKRARKRKRSSTSTSNQGFDAAFPEYATNAS